METCLLSRKKSYLALSLSIELSFNITLDIAEAAKKNSFSFRGQRKYVGLQGVGVFGESVGGEGTRPYLTRQKISDCWTEWKQLNVDFAEMDLDNGTI